jgi:ankyrin repeat protein
MEIFEAAKAGNESEVGRLLDLISLPEVQRRHQHTALEVAAQHGQVGVVKLLIEMMTQTSGVAGLHEVVALHLAAKHGQEAVVDILCDSGADLDSTALGDRTPLIWASSQGHVNVVQRLLYYMGGEGIDEKGECYKRLTALHYAAAIGHEEVVKLLLQRGADATIVSAWGATPLSSACEGGHLGVVQLLFDHQGVQALGMTASTGATPLHYAARGGREDVVKFLLGKGADANSQREDGWTPFTEALSEGHIGVARMLLEHMGGEDLDARDTYGQTALFHAAGGGHEDMVAFLLSKGAKANIQDEHGATPFIETAYNSGHVGVARLLLEHMAEGDVNARDNCGRTALFHAAAFGREDMVAFLLSKGANATIASNPGGPPLEQAMVGGHVGVVRILLEHMGVQNIDTRSDWGKRGLCYAACCGHEDMVAFVLSKGATADIQDEHGMTPLMQASIKGYVGMARMLLEHMGGKGLDTTDNEGLTALHHAASWGYDDMVSLLLAKGADPNITALNGRTALACACRGLKWSVVLHLATHMGQHALETRDSEGRTPLYLACEEGDWEWARLFLLAGADHTTTDNQGHRPPGFDEDLLPVSAAHAHLVVSNKGHFAKSCCGYPLSPQVAPCCPPSRMCTHAPD